MPATCPVCRAPFVEGMLFCEECAAPLVDIKATMAPTLAGELIVLPLRNRIPLQGPGRWILGRGQPKNLGPYERWIDLSPYNAYELGVSRRHARLEITPEGKAFITDLHSSNGTRVEYVRLTPGVAYPLPPSAYLRLGRLTLEWRQKMEE